MIVFERQLRDVMRVLRNEVKILEVPDVMEFQRYSNECLGICFGLEVVR